MYTPAHPSCPVCHILLLSYDLYTDPNIIHTPSAYTTSACDIRDSKPLRLQLRPLGETTDDRAAPPIAVRSGQTLNQIRILLFTASSSTRSFPSFLSSTSNHSLGSRIYHPQRATGAIFNWRPVTTKYLLLPTSSPPKLTEDTRKTSEA